VVERQRAESPFTWLYNDVAAWKRRFGLEGAALSVRACRESRPEAVRKTIQDHVHWFRSHPDSPRKYPALRHSLGMLAAACGDFPTAQTLFQEVAAQVQAPVALAQIGHNAYLVALEQGDWTAALASLNQAAALDPGHFAPFPPELYQSQRILGAGGFAVVFLCKDRRTGNPVVIKALQTESANGHWPDRFHEVGVLKELDHPSIIRLHAHAYADEAAKARPYLVVEYFDGLSLADYVNRYGPLSPENTLAVARPVAEALRAAHAHGIWHRDVKPGNILIRCDGSGWQVKLIDFGVAMREKAPHASAPFGTPDYAAPEQLGTLPEVAVGPTTDVYGFGRTCCYALFGTPYLSAEALEKLPSSLSRLLTQCLMEQPHERSANFDAVLAQLPAVERMRGIEPPTQPTAPIPPEDRDAKQPQSGEAILPSAVEGGADFGTPPAAGGPAVPKTAPIGEPTPKPLIRESQEPPVEPPQSGSPPKGKMQTGG
jgi:serine/threonine protein kinase